MELVEKLALILIVAILLTSGYFLFFGGEENKDAKAPVIDTITGNATGIAGETVTISVNFSDNVGVTNAMIYWKSASDSDWGFKSILNGSVDIPLPSDSSENWYYYVTIDDAAGNGPVGDPSINGSVYYTITVTKTGDDDDNDTTGIHYVFIEESTATTCQYCPVVSDIIHELYESKDYPFYYVSMVQDNENADERLQEHYNLYGNPTMYIDGGYEVIVGKKEKSVYEDKIQTAVSRNAPDLSVDVTAENNTNDSEIIVTAIVKNNENSAYEGTLKVYLTEIISTKWQDYDGTPYHFSFLEFAMDRTITVSANSQESYTEDIDLADLDPENLAIFAVVFSNEKHQGYSNPPGEKPFDAYYADAANKTTVVEGGNLPPEVGITLPKKGRLHIFGKDIMATFSQKTILIGRTTIKAQASDDSAISKVEFYLDGQLVKEFTKPPYEWIWKTPSWLKVKHTLQVTAYDDEEKTSTATMDVVAVILL